MDEILPLAGMGWDATTYPGVQGLPDWNDKIYDLQAVGDQYADSAVKLAQSQTTVDKFLSDVTPEAIAQNVAEINGNQAAQTVPVADNSWLGSIADTAKTALKDVVVGASDWFTRISLATVGIVLVFAAFLIYSKEE